MNTVSPKPHASVIPFHQVMNDLWAWQEANRRILKELDPGQYLVGATGQALSTLCFAQAFPDIVVELRKTAESKVVLAYRDPTANPEEALRHHDVCTLAVADEDAVDGPLAGLIAAVRRLHELEHRTYLDSRLEDELFADIENAVKAAVKAAGIPLPVAAGTSDSDSEAPAP